MSKPNIAYQLYSARQEAAKDLRAVLTTVQQQGDDGVEFAGFYGHSVEDIKQMLADIGLQAASSHVPLKDMQEDPEGIIAYHNAIGIKFIALPYVQEVNRPGQPGFAALFPLIYQFGQQCKEAGIQLLYHNHDFEFERVSGAYGLDFMYDAVPADLLMTEIDTCWVKYAGVDPVHYLAKYKGRAPVVHLKDFVGYKGDTPPYQLIGMDDKPEAKETAFSFKPYGYGIQDVDAVTKAAIDAGAQWLVIEQDESPDMPPLKVSEMSIGTLRKQGL